MSWIKITVLTHKKSGNKKYYRTKEAAIAGINKTDDKNLDNWNFQEDFVWD